MNYYIYSRQDIIYLNRTTKAAQDIIINLPYITLVEQKSEYRKITSDPSFEISATVDMAIWMTQKELFTCCKKSNANFNYCWNLLIILTRIDVLCFKNKCFV